MKSWQQRPPASSVRESWRPPGGTTKSPRVRGGQGRPGEAELTISQIYFTHKNKSLATT